MKIWQLLSPKNLTRGDRDLPALTSGYAKVKITRALLSESDAAVYSGAKKVKYPVIPGRYAVGQVVETGADALFNKGDRVYLADATDNEEAESGVDVAGETKDGFYRDFVCVSASEAYALPPTVSDEAAFLIDAVATAEKIVDETGVEAGRHVLVVGGGLYANILCQILIWHRAVPVLADNNAERLTLAKKCGIYYTFPYDDTLRENLLRITGGMLADAAVYFAFSNKSEPSRVFSLVRRGASAVFCARTEKSVAINLENAMKNDVTVKCVSDNREYISSAINDLANKAVTYGEFTFKQSSEEALPAALEKYAEGDASVLNEEINIFKFIF
ncbi:MAG: alcohol dehydrogenase catalytic domain-containing protein [Candidatus Borkfalkiaceae bacterium]|nr:alcohol dehydrogenase catalytic domain-containing protein [Clostridia bacterium]MDY6222977.1 alcohol dehydrogenase catalytic domain-containing protein [Christensenellaceae bacterium]